MAEYSKEELNGIVRSVSFVDSMCAALNIINDTVAMNGDILKDVIQATIDDIKKRTNGEFDFSFESF